MRSCEDVRELIPWYVEGQLSPEENVVVAQHLLECEDCLRDVATTLRLRGAVREALLTEPRVSEAMWERVSRHAMGRKLAQLDVGSFLLGLRLGARLTRRGNPVQADLRLLGREVRLVNRNRKGGSS
jgi:anti-sigma factor RsiW